ncbi:MAG: acyl transferase domain-containing protein/acyl carrier protein [Cyclobacteriaceae bacterium]|jgi:acyl transferase domain-containing protein/acyl carrier protein/NADP-dependent 3-hydroxy acid dehydrogenase YdfG
MSRLSNKIAIVGISGVFPEAQNLNEFYLNLRGKKDSVKEPTIDRLKYTSTDPSKKYRLAGHLDRIDLFDFKFFGISKKEAEFMEPTQRITLQLACQAIENAGYSLPFFEGSNTALYLATNSSISNAYRSRIGEVYQDRDATIHIGNLSSMIFGRIAYSLKLEGPAVMIDTGCSSGLVAVNEASEKLLNRKVDYALVGGVNLKLDFFPVESQMGHLGASSPKGKTRAFDAEADGIGVGEGGGMILLKRYEDAVRDKDNIHAVILGAGITQDGGRSNSIAAPSPEAQTKAILNAWKEAEIEPNSISYVEAHGAGTQLGDMIEFQSLTDAFNQSTEKKGICALSAVKSNIGHLGNLAGIAGIIKAVLSLKHKEILPTINFDKVNPYINQESSAAYIATETKEWVSEGLPRRCGVSCFGLSGTNAHLVLEEAPVVNSTKTERSHYFPFLKVSAKSQITLQSYINNIIKFLGENESDVASITQTLNIGRGDYSYRSIVEGNDKEELISALKELNPEKLVKTNNSKKAVLLFSNEIDENNEFTTLEKDLKTRYIKSKEALLVINQYVMYQKLIDYGVDILTVIGTGVGKLTSQIISGKITLGEALSRAEKGEVSCDPVNQEVLGNVVSTLAEKNDLLFVETDSIQGISSYFLEADHSVFKFFNKKSGSDLNGRFCELYKLGVDIDWHCTYGLDRLQKIEVPTYPFEKNRCWYEPPINMDLLSARQSLFSFEWDSVDFISGTNDIKTSSQTFLVVKDKLGLAEEVKSVLEQNNNKCILLSAAEEFQVVSAQEIEVDFNSSESLKELKSYTENIQIDGILSLINYADIDQPNVDNYQVQLDHYFFSQFQLARLFHNELEKGISFTIVTANCYNILENSVVACNHMVGTLAKNMIVDFPKSQIAHVDFELNGSIKEYAYNLITELSQEEPIRIFGFRNSKKYVARINNIHVSDDFDASGFTHREGGNYLITGGSSGIGLEVSKAIAKLGKCSLIIIGKSKLPDRKDWEKSLTKKHLYSESLIVKVKEFLLLEESGVTIDYYKADLVNTDAFTSIIDHIKEKYDTIDGIVHSAGIGNKGTSIDNISDDYFDGVFGPKIGGSLALLDIVNSFNPEFFLMFSTIGTIVPSKNSIAYSCGNAFLDALSEIYKGHVTKFRTINWSDWKETGLVYRKNLGRTDEEKANRQQVLEGLSNAEGILAINYALTLNKPQIAVIKTDLSGFRINPFFNIDIIEDTKSSSQNHFTDTKTFVTERSSAKNLIKDEYSEMEKKVVEIWNSVLKLDSIDLDDDFYEVGGHSLNMTQMLNKIEKEVGVMIPMEELLDNSTVRNLAKRVEVLKDENFESNLQPIKPVENKSYYQLSHAQKRFWILNQLENKEAYNVPCVFKFKGNVDMRALEQSFLNLIHRHEVLRTGFEVVDSKPMQKVYSSEEVDFKIGFIQKYDEGTLERQINDVLAEPFDLSVPPMIKVRVFELAENVYILAMAIPHIVADGRSVYILRNEVLSVYNSIIQGTELDFEQPRIQYKDFAEWQVENIQSGKYKESQSYWRERLADIYNYSMNIPVDFTDSANFEAGQHEFKFETHQVKQLREIAKANSTTLFIVVMSVFKILLHKTTNQSKIVLGSPVNGRTEQTNSQIGTFLNTVVFFSTIMENDTYHSFLSKVKRDTVKDLSNSSFPYDLLVTEIAQQNNAVPKELFEIGYTWNKKEVLKEVDNTDFEIESYPFELRKAKKDLWLIISEEEDALWSGFIYRKSVFQKETIQILAARFKLLTTQIIEDQEKNIANYDLTLDEELALEANENEKQDFDFNFLD